MPQELATFLQHVFNGLSISTVYILVGLGITLIFGLTRLVNFAHGQFLVLGGFAAYSLVDGGIPFWLALMIAPVVVGALGALLDLTIFRRTIDVPLNGFIVTLGLVIALQAIYVEAWSVDQFQVKSSVRGVWDLEGIRITHERTLLLGVATLVIAGLFALLRWTDIGRSMRAVAENREASAMVGVNVGRSISMAFLMGSALAGIGGALLFAIFPFTAFSGGPFVIKGLAVALIGGLGSVEGAVVVGLALGMAETLGTAYGIPVGFYEFGGEWKDGYAFLMMIAILVWRPRGLFRGVGSGEAR